MVLPVDEYVRVLSRPVCAKQNGKPPARMAVIVGPRGQAKEERSLRVVQKNHMKVVKSAKEPKDKKMKVSKAGTWVLSAGSKEKTAHPPERRLVRAIPKAVMNPEDLQGLTKLEMKSVSSEVQHQYSLYFTKFKEFCLVNSVQWPIPKLEADHVMCDYLDYMFEEGKSPHEGEKPIAALEYFRMEVKGSMLRCKRAMRGWKKAMPPQSRLPLPRLAMMGIAM